MVCIYCGSHRCSYCFLVYALLSIYRCLVCIDLLQGAKGANITIDILCEIMCDDALGTPLKRYAAINDLILKTYGMKCLDAGYNDFIQSMKETSWQSSASEGGIIIRELYSCLFLSIYPTAKLILLDSPFAQKCVFVSQCKTIKYFRNRTSMDVSNMY